jgi:iron complex outermembrane receptor protein
LQTTTQNPPFLPVSQINSVNKSNAWMNKLMVNHQFSDRNEIRFFLTFDEEWVETNNYENLASRKSISSKVISSNVLSKNVSSKFSLQYDWVDGRAVGLMPSASISLIMPELESLRFNFGASKKYRIPGMNDLHWYPGGNPDLKPEKASVYDLQLAHQLMIDDFEMETSITAYYSFIDDWIQWRPTSYRYWIPENIAKVHARGLELHHKSSFYKGGFNFSVAMNQAYTVTTDESSVARLELTSGKQLIYIPRFHGNALLRVEKKSVSFYYQFEYTGSRFTNFSNNDAHYSKLPAYALHHAGIGTVVFNKINIQFSIQNIYNKAYQVVMWRPMPGRHFLLQMVYEFKKSEKK